VDSGVNQFPSQKKVKLGIFNNNKNVADMQIELLKRFLPEHNKHHQFPLDVSQVSVTNF